MSIVVQKGDPAAAAHDAGAGAATSESKANKIEKKSEIFWEVILLFAAKAK